MATIEADRAYPQEARYWKMVESTLVSVFGTTGETAGTLVRDQVRRMADASPLERLLTFHNEPFGIAAALFDPAHRTTEAEHRSYQQLARNAGWGYSHPASAPAYLGSGESAALNP